MKYFYGHLVSITLWFKLPMESLFKNILTFKWNRLKIVILSYSTDLKSSHQPTQFLCSSSWQKDDLTKGTAGLHRSVQSVQTASFHNTTRILNIIEHIFIFMPCSPTQSYSLFDRNVCSFPTFSIFSLWKGCKYSFWKWGKKEELWIVEFGLKQECSHTSVEVFSFRILVGTVLVNLCLNENLWNVF